MIKAVIFDCFGVLYPNASANFFQRHKNLFGNNSVYLDKLNLEIDLAQVTRAAFFAKLEKEIGIPAYLIQREIDQELMVDQQLIQLIKKLKKSYKLAMLSNAGQEEIEVIYRDKIDKLFDTITVSCHEGIVKPNLEIYTRCIKKLGVKPEECLFIDDSEKNIKAAQKLNMKAILYNSSENLSSKLNELNITLKE